MKTVIKYAPDFSDFSGRMFAISFDSILGMEASKHGLGNGVVSAGCGSQKRGAQLNLSLFESTGYAYGQVSFSRQSTNCGSCGNVSTRSEPVGVTLDCDASAAPIETDILRFVSDSRVIVLRRHIAKMLLDAGFSGVIEVPIEVDSNDHRFSGLACLKITGTAAVGQRRIVSGGNICPFCHSGKLLCEECGSVFWHCNVCKRQSICSERQLSGIDDIRIAWPYVDIADTIFDPRGWNGTDISIANSSCFASPRLIQWLVDRDIGVFSAYPIRVGVPIQHESR